MFLMLHDLHCSDHLPPSRTPRCVQATDAGRAWGMAVDAIGGSGGQMDGTGTNTNKKNAWKNNGI